MNDSSPSIKTEQLGFFELVDKGEVKKAPLIKGLSETTIDRSNIDKFLSALDGLTGALPAELLESIWKRLDRDCKERVLTVWLKDKDADQSAAGQLILASRLLVQDMETAIKFVDKVEKLTPMTQKVKERIIKTIRSEWINGTGTTKSRCLDLTAECMARPNGVVIITWLVEACSVELKPTDNETRREEIRKQNDRRISDVSNWLKKLGREPSLVRLLPAINHVLGRLGQSQLPVTEVPSTSPTLTISPDPTGVAPHGREVTSIKEDTNLAANPPATSSRTEKLDETLITIRQMFTSASERHARELSKAQRELALANDGVARANRETAEARSATAKAVDRLAELEGELKQLQETQKSLKNELSESMSHNSQLSARIDEERRLVASLRAEHSQTVLRESQRERDRLLVSLGQRVRNIVDNYREIQARGPMPEGAPKMVAAMFDELLARLEAMGVSFKE